MNDHHTSELNDAKIMDSNHAILVIGIGLLLLVMAIVFWPGTPMGSRTLTDVNGTISPTPSTATKIPTATPIPQPSQIPTITPTFQPISETFPSFFGALVLAVKEGSDTHLFAYQPLAEMSSVMDLEALPLTRLTTGNHDDIHPAIHPDGSMVAFASNRNGPWDIFLLNLRNGEITQLTDTTAYDGNPTWSPDGKWVAFESYQDQNFDIFIQDAKQESGPINLTNHPAPDHSPNWSGQGRRISFISLRDGSPQVWMANLDSPEDDKAELAIQMDSTTIEHPSWSLDGRYLSWSATIGEEKPTLYTWDSQQPEKDPMAHGFGDWPVWGSEGELLYSLIDTPKDTYLTAYLGSSFNSQIVLPAIKMPGKVKGFSWAPKLQLAFLQGSSKGELSLSHSNPGEQTQVTEKDIYPIRDVEAPYAQLNENAVNPFQTLRSTTVDELGWDFLATLENAYVPLTAPLTPGADRNWLYTGRAISVSDLPRKGGWMVIVREDYGSDIYWHVYLRTSNQQGYQGQPMKDFPWDFDARFSGDNLDYENGGRLSPTLPKGYYLDFTDLAESFGWERLPALRVWQSSLTLTRFQVFVFRENLSWWDAMMEIHSPGAIRDQLGIEGP